MFKKSLDLIRGSGFFLDFKHTVSGPERSISDEYLILKFSIPNIG